MAFTRDVRINVLGDSKSLERTFARSTAATKKFQKDMGAVGQTATGLDRTFGRLRGGIAGAFVGSVAVGGTIAAMRKLSDAASDLNEQQTKNAQVFGQSSAAIEAWSKTTAGALGISQRAALEATGTFGNLFTAVGIGGKQAADMSQQLVRLASDMASFNNADISDVLLAIRSGLVGEAEPLRRYGVLLSEARVQQVALQQTGKKNAKELTNQEKAAARYSVILGDTTKAQGDFARTSDGLANQQRILTARWEDAQATLGRRLLPAMIKVTEAANAMLGSFQNLEPASRLLSKNFRDDLADAFGADAVREILAKAAPEIQQAMDEFASTVDPFNLNVPITLTPQVVGKTGGLTPPKEFAKLPGVKVDFASAILGPIDKAIALAKKQAADAIRKGRAAISKEAAETARQKQRKAFEDLLDALGLGVERAAATPGIRDDLRRNTALQNAIKRQIAVEGRTTELARKLFEARQARAAIIAGEAGKTKTAQDAAARKAAEALQARQFRALGLTGEGDEPVPGIKNLAKRINQALRNENLGKVDISSKLISRLKAARKLIKTEGGKLTEDTRRVINDFLKAVTGQDAKTRQGPLTKGSAINSGKILEGLLLPPGTEKTLRARLSRLNSVAGTISAPRVPRASTASTFGQPVVENHITVTLDRDVVSRAVTRSQQKTRRRNPPQKRGPNVQHGI